MARFRKTKGNRDWVAHDSQMAVLAAILIVFIVAGSLSDGRIIPDFSGGSVKSDAAAATQSDDDLKTGSIYITSPDDNICELRLIDNATWTIRPAGNVVCHEAVSWAAQEASRNAAQRIEAIRDGFVQKR